MEWYSVILLSLLMTAVRTEMIDLTHYNDKNAQTFPINRRFNLTFTNKGWWALFPSIWLENEEFAMASHTGTHMDAPSHFRKGGWPVDQIPPERFISPAVVVDHQARVAKNKNDPIQVSDLLEWEEQHGRIPSGAMILCRSGWSKFYKNDTEYFGNPDPRQRWQEGLNYPGISNTAAEFLAKERTIFGVGTETASIDPGNATGYPAHVTFAAADILMIENVGNGIHKLPPSGATVISLPINNKGASGAPIRMLAYWGDDVQRFAPVAGSPDMKLSVITLSFVYTLTRLFI